MNIMYIMFNGEVVAMQTYTLSDVRNRHGEIFDRAIAEPVLLTKQKRPSHVILSAAAYKTLIDRLAMLEDQALGIAAEGALASSSMVGAQAFTDALNRLADAEA